MIHSIEKNNKLKGSILRKSKNSTNSWKNEGAEYLSLHQKIDEARLSRLKKSVQQFEEIQSQELINRVNVSGKYAYLDYSVIDPSLFISRWLKKIYLLRTVLMFYTTFVISAQKEDGA